MPNERAFTEFREEMEIKEFKEFPEDLDKLLVFRKLNIFRTIWKLSKEISETFVSVRKASEFCGWVESAHSLNYYSVDKNTDGFVAIHIVKSWDQANILKRPGHNSVQFPHFWTFALA